MQDAMQRAMPCDTNTCGPVGAQAACRHAGTRRNPNPYRRDFFDLPGWPVQGRASYRAIVGYAGHPAGGRPDQLAYTLDVLKLQVTGSPYTSRKLLESPNAALAPG